MSAKPLKEEIDCPHCGQRDYSPWTTELGFAAVRCRHCALLYVNPRPSLALIGEAVASGVHRGEAEGLNVRSHHDPRKVARYRRILGRIFDDVWRSGRRVSWLDVGAGYGEVVEAVTALAAPGSRVEGLDPMAPKATHARSRGVAVSEGYLRPDHEKVDFLSVVDVFSHIPRFDVFLADVCAVLKPAGEIFVETGNLADLAARHMFPGELGLPDHLVFAGERHLSSFLHRAGFEVTRIERVRIDGFVNLAKNLVKKIIGRPAALGIPYTSGYRQLLVRARLRQ